MKIGFNFVNSGIILLLLLLFILFKYDNNNSSIGYLFIFISLLSGCFFFYKSRIKNSIICFYLMILFIFYWVNYIYSDNFSVQSLINEYGIGENDRLEYKFLIKTNNELNKCKIHGEYDKNNSDITVNYSNDNLCEDIMNNLGNKFIYGENKINQENLEENINYIEIFIAVVLSIVLIIYLMNFMGIFNKSEIDSEMNLDKFE